MIGVSAFAQRVLQHHRALGQALRAGGAHVVGLEHLQHRAARVAHQHGGDRVAEHEGRHDHRSEVGAQVLERADVARGRQPAELHREEQDHQDAEPEVGRRQAPERDRVGRVVPDRAATDRRDDAGRYADDEREAHRQDRQLDRQPAASARSGRAPAAAFAPTRRDRRARRRQSTSRSAPAARRRGGAWRAGTRPRSDRAPRRPGSPPDRRAAIAAARR